MRRWRDIDGYYGIYQISDDGLVLNTKRGRLRKPRLDKDGYYFLTLHLDKKRKRESVHRLVAAAFLPNPNQCPVVNHKNGIKTDNNVNNLEWCTVRENNLHAIHLGLNSPVRRNHKVSVKDTESGEEMVFVSKRSAGKFFGTSGVSINEWIKGIIPKRDDLKKFKFSIIP